MSARLARSAFQSAARRAQTTLSSSASSVSRRTMSSASGNAKSSDTPWIVGATLVFGPAFLYLVSPTGRNSTKSVHNDLKEHPTLKRHDAAPHKPEEVAAAAPVEIMTDDEGTEANVGATIALSQGSDVPKESQSPEKQAELLTDAETAGVPKQKSEPASAPAQEGSDGDAHEHIPKASSFKKEGEGGPVEMEVPEQKAVEGVTPLDNAKESKEDSA
ncbi:hypothetical protein JR316_0006963 [Psilocybe cubensis]|uniref:Uncharacterized protein n=2 Tax=Psilocybe cubensis TaxID=181762 RepID=A0ACB8GZI0_PSICU|nr:hypothetical protein JR316_0006963 [Psilocybe cubensis]KAH9480365.1 hypothetical protein JR316_0006963 [Psilocybe cubensis]